MVRSYVSVLGYADIYKAEKEVGENDKASLHLYDVKTAKDKVCDREPALPEGSHSDLQGTQMVEGFHHLCLIIAQLPCRSESDSSLADQTICHTLYLLLFSHTNIICVAI